jgi:hypothetical protein
MAEVAWAASSRCWGCGRDVAHKPNGGPHRFHACSLRLLSRLRWKAHQEGWHSGYRFAVENADDPMVTADADDYGTGWAAHMRVGYVAEVSRDEGSRS